MGVLGHKQQAPAESSACGVCACSKQVGHTAEQVLLVEQGLLLARLLQDSNIHLLSTTDTKQMHPWHIAHGFTPEHQTAVLP